MTAFIKGDRVRVAVYSLDQDDPPFGAVGTVTESGSYFVNVRFREGGEPIPFFPSELERAA